MTDFILLVRIHFGISRIKTIRNKPWVIPMAIRSTTWPYQCPIGPPFKQHRPTIRPRQRKRRHKICGTIMAIAHLVPYAFHGCFKITLNPSPPRGINAGPSPQSINTKPTIVRKRHATRSLRSRSCLQQSVRLKRLAGFFRFCEPQSAARSNLLHMRTKERREFRKFSGIVRCNHKRRGRQ